LTQRVTTTLDDGASLEDVVSSVADRVQNGRVCQKYIALTEANVTEYIAQISEAGSYTVHRTGLNTIEICVCLMENNKAKPYTSGRGTTCFAPGRILLINSFFVMSFL